MGWGKDKWTGRARAVPHQTGLWNGKGPLALIQSLQRPCPPTPSSGNRPPPAHAGLRTLPGEHQKVSSSQTHGASSNPSPTAYLMEANDGFWVDAHNMQAPAVTLQELSKKPQKDSTKLLVLKEQVNISEY